ncbi:7-carboxy-7-deazaguanine synthase [Bacteroidia bacterium]|nr:7-carboxy-7-deazaguanine synthase [Bacteroidia bacterium]GHU82085.1 7-carboxy-7-deazaguanine synthase [Bacteroidia bacterium]
MNLQVNEIFYSLQGEGSRQGEASIFIRLTGCNLKCDFCDTDFAEGKEMQADEILDFIRQFPCLWIVWTGGEPSLQLTDEILLFFKEAGFRQAIESNGHKPLSALLDYTVVSPKGNVDYARKINSKVNEIRLPVQKDDKIPSIAFLPEAEYYFLSPVFTEEKTSTKANIDYCVEQIKQHPEWRLSLQIHKLIGIE